MFTSFQFSPNTHIRKLGNLGNVSLLSNFDSSYKLRFKNNRNMNWAKNWKLPIWFKRTNKNYRDFRVLDFALYPRSETRKFRKFCLSQILTLDVTQGRILTLDVTQGLKTPKKWTESKNKRFRYDLEQNQSFPRFPSFRFCSKLKVENLEI